MGACPAGAVDEEADILELEAWALAPLELGMQETQGDCQARAQNAKEVANTALTWNANCNFSGWIWVKGNS